MDRKIEGYYSTSELVKEFKKPKATIRYWIRKGWLKSEKGLNKFCLQEVFVKEEDWFNLPAYIRNRHKTKSEKG